MSGEAYYDPDDSPIILPPSPLSLSTSHRSCGGGALLAAITEGGSLAVLDAAQPPPDPAPRRHFPSAARRAEALQAALGGGCGLPTISSGTKMDEKHGGVLQHQPLVQGMDVDDGVGLQVAAAAAAVVSEAVVSEAMVALSPSSPPLGSFLLLKRRWAMLIRLLMQVIRGWGGGWAGDIVRWGGDAGWEQWEWTERREGRGGVE